MNGLPIDIRIIPANESERDVCFQILLDQDELTVHIDTVYVDGGYHGERFESEVFMDTAVMLEIVPRKKKLFEVVPKRWIVERSFSWLDKCRRLWKNTER